MWETGSTTTVRFFDFIQRIPNDMGPGTPQRCCCLTMDNLSSHRNLLVQQIIHNAGHQIAFRAPYYPVDGPIEYYFNHMQMGLTLAMYPMDFLAGIQAEVKAGLRNSSTFRPFLPLVVS